MCDQSIQAGLHKAGMLGGDCHFYLALLVSLDSRMTVQRKIEIWLLRLGFNHFLKTCG